MPFFKRGGRAQVFRAHIERRVKEDHAEEFVLFLVRWNCAMRYKLKRSRPVSRVASLYPHYWFRVGDRFYADLENGLFTIARGALPERHKDADFEWLKSQFEYKRARYLAERPQPLW